MAIYIFYYEQFSPSVSITDQFADSLYYLGFLMTIIALVAALVPYSTNLSAISAEAVLSRFGIALLTTLVGLGGRVFYSQFSATPEQADADAQASLMEITQSFVTELVISTESIQNLRIKVEEEINALKATMSEHIKEVTETSTKEINKVAETSSAVTERVIEDVRGAINHIVSEMNAIEISPDILTSSLNSSLSGVTSQVGELAKMIGKMKGALTRSQEKWEAHSEQLGHLIDALRTVQGIGTSFAESEKRIMAVSGALERLREQVTVLEEGSKAAAKELSENVGHAKSVRVQLEKELLTVADLRKELVEEIGAASKASSAMYQAIIDGSAFLVRQLGGSAENPPKGLLEARSGVQHKPRDREHYGQDSHTTNVAGTEIREPSLSTTVADTEDDGKGRA